MKKTFEIGPREAARTLGVRLDSIYSLIWAGKLEAEKRDGKWFISERAIHERLQARETRNG